MGRNRLSVRQIQCLFAAFHMLAVIYAVCFLHPYYGSNDEFSLAAIASGAYGEYTQYFVYLHSGFGWLLKGFYTLMPEWNWYTLVMHGLIFCSLTSIGCVWIRRSPRVGAVLSAMLTLACAWPLYVELQYTKTAAIVTAAGYTILLCAGGCGEQKDMPAWNRGAAGGRLSALCGIALLLLGSWIRFHAFAMVSLAAFGLWLPKAAKAWKEKAWKLFFWRDCMPCAIAFLLVFGSILAENALVYKPGSPQEHYREYDRARQQLLDYGVPAWEGHQADYEALGLTRTDCINLQNWLIADSDRYTADVYKAIVAFRQDRPFQWEYLADYLLILAKKPLFVLGAIVTGLWLAFALPAGGRKGWFPVACSYLALLGFYLYFIKIYRVLPLVVTACLISFLVFVFSSVEEGLGRRWEEKLEGKRFPAALLLGAALTAGLCVHMLATPALRPAPQSSEASGKFRALYDTISRNKELYYVLDPLTSNGMELGYSIFEKLPDHYMSNLFALGGWETESPQVVSNLEAYGQRNLMTSLYTSDRAVLISNTLLEHLLLHLQDTYDGIFITYSKVNQIGDFDLFALNYKMNRIKEPEEAPDLGTASLDRTYMAEKERYDVFEATVNMTPQELEGRSVFLWTKSVETGKIRMFQGTWQQQDENGLYSMIYDVGLAATDQARFMVPKLSFPLDDRYEAYVVVRFEERGWKLATENRLYQ